jgi:hypothetical protein
VLKPANTTNTIIKWSQELFNFMYIFAERESSAIYVLGAVHAARSMNRDKHVYSL